MTSLWSRIGLAFALAGMTQVGAAAPGRARVEYGAMNVALRPLRR